jgi:predicted DNA-binding transcriptional regulator YafY
MSSKLQRWIDLLAALLRRQYPVSFEQLARDVPGYLASDQSAETRRRMFERDKKDLRSFGVPIETVELDEGESGYRLSRAQFYLPYLEVLNDGRRGARRPPRYGYRSLPSLTFDPDELAGVFRAAQRVEALGMARLTEDACSALRKLGHDLPMESEPDGVHHAGQLPPADPDVFDALSGALRSRKRVTFTYHSMDRDVVTERTVEPYGLFFLGHHWYLAGTAPGERLVKNFRLNRITHPAVNAVAPATPDYAIPASFSLREHATARHAWELGSGDVTEVIVRVAERTGAALATSRLGEPVTGDPTAYRFRVRRLDAFARWILGAGGAVLPLSPPELVQVFRARAMATAALYQEAL